jgi:hypothetical protein
VPDFWVRRNLYTPYGSRAKILEAPANMSNPRLSETRQMREIPDTADRAFGGCRQRSFETACARYLRPSEFGRQNSGVAASTCSTEKYHYYMGTYLRTKRSEGRPELQRTGVNLNASLI